MKVAPTVLAFAPPDPVPTIVDTDLLEILATSDTTETGLAPDFIFWRCAGHRRPWFRLRAVGLLIVLPQQAKAPSA